MSKKINPWFLLYCKRSEQERARENLVRQGIDCYFPQVTVEKVRRGKRSAILEPLFPNYIFASFDQEKISHTTVRSTRGVVDFVRFGLDPCEVPFELILTLREHEDNEQQREQLSEVILKGDFVDVIDGQFSGAEAIFKESDGEYRSILLINLLNKQVEFSEQNSSFKKKQ